MNELIAVIPTNLVQREADNRLVDLFIATKRSANTRCAYGHSIAMLRERLGKPFGEVTLEDAVSYLAWLQERYQSLHSIRLHIDIAKSLFGFGVAINYLRMNVMKPLRPDTPSEITHKRILTEEQVLKLIDAPKHQRDKLLLRLLYAAGLRVGEVCGLVWSDLLPIGVLHVRHAKGQKERFVTLGPGLVEQLNSLRGDDGAPMFRSQKGGHLDASRVLAIVREAATVAGIPGKVSPHWLRHSHASHSLDRGASPVLVRDTLGHSSIAVTNKYLHSKRSDSSALHLIVS